VQKLRQLPAGYGDGCLQQTVDAPAVAADSRHLLTAFRYRGLVMVEFKRDPRDGAQFLMEINPRTVGAFGLRAAAGGRSWGPAANDGTNPRAAAAGGQVRVKLRRASGPSGVWRNYVQAALPASPSSIATR